MKKELLSIGESLKERLVEMNRFIHDNPELGNEEYKAVEKLTTFLKEHDFEINAQWQG